MAPANNNWLLSGGIGSGKSEVRRLLADRGLLTVDADSVGHSVLEPGGEAWKAVAARWPDTVRDGAIDRRALGSLVFEDPEQLRELEGITHPLIFSSISRIVSEANGTAIVEVPVLRQPFDESWRRIVVDASDEIRLERVIDRGMSRADAVARMKAQPSRLEWLAVADLVIPNNGSLSDLRSTVGSSLAVLTGV